MGKAKHPCAGLGLTKAARLWFEDIATGGSRAPPSKKAAEALENYGLIEKLPDRVLGRDRFGTIAVPQWQASLWAHSDYCAWASENYGDNQADTAPVSTTGGSDGQ